MRVVDLETRGPRFARIAVAGIVILLIIGLALVLGAKLTGAKTIIMDSDDFDTHDEYQEAVDKIHYNVTFLSSFGLTLVTIGLILAALVIEDLGDSVRCGLAVAAGIVIGLTSLFGFS